MNILCDLCYKDVTEGENSPPNLCDNYPIPEFLIFKEIQNLWNEDVGNLQLD